MTRLGPEHTTTALPYFDLPSPRVLAHRGLAVGAPENTLLAMLQALAAGARYLEIDVHATRDGVAVVCHDPDLVRLVNRTDKVCDLDFAELSSIPLGQGQTISSLSQVLDALPDARLNIDIKASDAVAPTAAAIHAARARDRVLITSFSERRRRAAVRLVPGVATSASSARFAIALLATALRIPVLAGLALRGIHAVQVPVRHAGIPIATPRMVRMLHRHDVEIHIWTINDRATMSRLLDLGVDGIVSDRADIALQVIAERSPSEY